MSEKCEWLAIRVRPKVPRAHRRRVCSANGRRAGAAGHSSQAASTPSSVGFDLVSGRSRRRGVKIGGSLFLRFSASGRLRTATTADEVARYSSYPVLRLSRSATTLPSGSAAGGRTDLCLKNANGLPFVSGRRCHGHTDGEFAQRTGGGLVPLGTPAEHLAQSTSTWFRVAVGGEA